MALEELNVPSANIPIITRAQGRQQRARKCDVLGAARFEWLVEAAFLHSKESSFNNDDEMQAIEGATISRKRALPSLREAIKPRAYHDENALPVPDLRVLQHKAPMAESAPKLATIQRNSPCLEDSVMHRVFPQPATNRIQRIGRSLFSLIVHNQLAGQLVSLEPALRAALGDSPDTSKALRSLVAAGLVQREGRGGRSDTFRYKVAKREWARLDLDTAAFASTAAPASVTACAAAVSAPGALSVDCGLSKAPSFTAALTASLLRGTEPRFPLRELYSGVSHRSSGQSSPAPRFRGGHGSGSQLEGSSALHVAGQQARFSAYSIAAPTSKIAGPLSLSVTSSYRAAAHASQESGIKVKPSWQVPVGSQSSLHSELLKVLPLGSWSQESAAHAAGSQAGGVSGAWSQEGGGHTLGSQASWLRLALASPQLPLPLFVPSSKASQRGSSAHSLASLTNLGVAAPSSASAQQPLDGTPANNSTVIPRVEAALEQWPPQSIQQHCERLQMLSALLPPPPPLHPLPSGCSVYQPPSAPSAAQSYPYATSRKAAQLTLEQLFAPEQ